MTNAAAIKLARTNLRDVTQNDRVNLIVMPSIVARTVAQLTSEIEQTARLADDATLVAAMALRELRKAIEAGAVGADVKWFAWARKNIRITEARLYRLQAIAEAADPNAELERIRKLDRERAKRYRERNRKNTSGITLQRERIELIRWAERAPLSDIRRTLDFIRAQSA